MTLDDRALAALLQAATPEPPRSIAVDDIAARVRAAAAGPAGTDGLRAVDERPPLMARTARPSRTLLLASAACIALLVALAALVVSERSPNADGPAAPVSSAPRPPSSSVPSSAPRSLPTSRATSSAPASSTVPSGQKVGPWDAVTVGGPFGDAAPLAADASSVYVRDGSQLLRLDPTFGAVLARHAYLAGTTSWASVAHGVLTVVVDDPEGGAELDRWSASDLAAISSLTVLDRSAARPSASIVASADASGGRIYVASQRTVAVVDMTTNRVVRRLTVHGIASIEGIAVSPDDQRLYVTGSAAGVGTLVVLDPASDTVVDPPATVNPDGGAQALAASSGGLWLQTGSGHELALVFAPGGDPTRAGVPAVAAGGGFVTSAVRGSGVVWVSGTDAVACADPLTGVVRESEPMPAPRESAANISGLVVGGQRLFGYYTDDVRPDGLLVRLTAPAACRP
ncbi:MAG: YncE family protein [Jatrophihabitans sp.]|uniref:YncE family protein n=1 Tax=Jatrophihabitans sp. TaxID=1932789 RepID=UPI003F81DBA3